MFILLLIIGKQAEKDRNSSLFTGSNTVIYMVAVCKISKDGKLLKIIEVSDIYRYISYKWDEENN